MGTIPFHFTPFPPVWIHPCPRTPADTGPHAAQGSLPTQVLNIVLLWPLPASPLTLQGSERATAFSLPALVCHFHCGLPTHLPAPIHTHHAHYTHALRCPGIPVAGPGACLDGAFRRSARQDCQRWITPDAGATANLHRATWTFPPDLYAHTFALHSCVTRARGHRAASATFPRSITCLPFPLSGINGAAHLVKDATG